MFYLITSLQLGNDTQAFSEQFTGVIALINQGTGNELCEFLTDCSREKNVFPMRHLMLMEKSAQPPNGGGGWGGWRGERLSKVLRRFFGWNAGIPASSHGLISSPSFGLFVRNGRAAVNTCPSFIRSGRESWPLPGNGNWIDRTGDVDLHCSGASQSTLWVLSGPWKNPRPLFSTASPG